MPAENAQPIPAKASPTSSFPTSYTQALALHVWIVGFLFRQGWHPQLTTQIEMRARFAIRSLFDELRLSLRCGRVGIEFSKRVNQLEYIKHNVTESDIEFRGTLSIESIVK